MAGPELCWSDFLGLRVCDPEADTLLFYSSAPVLILQEAWGSVFEGYLRLCTVRLFWKRDCEVSLHPLPSAPLYPQAVSNCQAGFVSCFSVQTSCVFTCRRI